MVNLLYKAALSSASSIVLNPNYIVLIISASIA